MQPTRSSIRRPLAAAAAGALALSIGAAGAGTAGAAVSTTALCTNVATGQSGFTDIGDTAPHTRNIECLKGSGVTSGVTATTYVPGGQVSRAQMATFIANAIDVANALDAPGGATIPDLPASAPDAFSDDNGNTHEANINRLKAAGIISGQTDTTFNPSGIVNRGQMATFVAQALAFVRGGELPAGDDAFTDDAGNAHEANINRLANADIVDGTSATTFSPNNPVIRAQMASFIVQALADLLADGFITPIPPAGATGVVTAVGASTYTFTVGQTSMTVTFDTTNDVYVVDGTASSHDAFAAALSVGDEVTYVDDTSAEPGDADQHRLTNVDPANRRSGTVGNVDTSANTFAIVDPVTGVVIGGPFTYTGDVLQVAGAAAAEPVFDGAINEGDTIQGTVDDADAETWNLSNQTVTGTAANVTDVGAPGDGQVSFTIGALGDDPKDAVDNAFVTGDDVAPATEVFTIAGTPATAAQFEAALGNGDTVAYSRNANAETFALTNVAPADQTGVATNAPAPSFGGAADGGSFTLADGPDDIAVTYTSGAAFTVGGLAVTEAEFELAYSPGDNVTYTPEDPDTAGNQERVVLTNADLTGRVDDVDTAANHYDVENTDGNVIGDNVAYSGVGNEYRRNGAVINEADFETLLTKIDADATPDDTVTVVVSGGVTQHQLTTDETV